jgi:formylglycine-generating enzyme required for sulfatase activity
MTQQDNKFRVYRGGSWRSNSGICRSADRYGITPDGRSSFLGFRVLRSSGKERAMTQQDNKFQVDRGGSWINNSVHCRSAYRSRNSPDSRYGYLGFRVLRSSKEEVKHRVFRGGSWSGFSVYCRSAIRRWSTPDSRCSFLGFRVLRSFNNSQSKENKMTTNNKKKIGLIDFVNIPENQEKGIPEFELGATPVTQLQWVSVMGALPDDVDEYVPNNPVTGVSCIDAVEFCEKLSEQTGEAVRLPTEEEWEHACRAGSDTNYHFGDNPAELEDYAVFDKEEIAEVATKLPNPYGLYDMHGLVWEWTSTPYEA